MRLRTFLFQSGTPSSQKVCADKYSTLQDDLRFHEVIFGFNALTLFTFEHFAFASSNTLQHLLVIALSSTVCPPFRLPRVVKACRCTAADLGAFPPAAAFWCSLVRFVRFTSKLLPPSHVRTLYLLNRLCYIF